MEFTEYFQALRDRWLSILVTALIVIGMTAGGTLLLEPQYTSSTRMFFAVQGGESVSDLAQGSNFTEEQMESYAEVAKSPLVLKPVIESLSLSSSPESLGDKLSVSVAASTTILVVSATDKDPAAARDIANAVADELAAAIGGLNPERPDGSEAVRATMLSEAQLPKTPSSPNIGRNIGLGVVLGLMLGIGFALLREVLDTKVRTERTLSSLTDASLLASVPMGNSEKAGSAFIHQEPMSPRAEAIRRLRTNLQFVDFTGRPNSILVTSAVNGEGKTTTAINLAASLADAGSRVIFIDADLRRPSVAEYMGFEGRAGLTTVLIGKATLNDVVQPWHNTSLDVLTSGQIPPNPSEMLGSPAMSRLLKELNALYDIIVIDSPPILPVTDSTILSRITGGTMLVVGADRAHKAQVSGSLAALSKVDARLLGIVLNKTDPKASSNYYGEYSAIPDPVTRTNRRKQTSSKPAAATHLRRTSIRR